MYPLCYELSAVYMFQSSSKSLCPIDTDDDAAAVCYSGLGCEGVFCCDPIQMEAT